MTGNRECFRAFVADDARCVAQIRNKLSGRARPFEQNTADRGLAEAISPGPEGRRRFHELFMQQGTIPPGYFEEVLLGQMKGQTKAPEGGR